MLINKKILNKILYKKLCIDIKKYECQKMIKKKLKNILSPKNIKYLMNLKKF